MQKSIIPWELFSRIAYSHFADQLNVVPVKALSG